MRSSGGVTRENCLYSWFFKQSMKAHCLAYHYNESLKESTKINQYITAKQLIRFLTTSRRLHKQKIFNKGGSEPACENFQ